MDGKIAFIQEYRRLATQMTDHRIAGNWMRLAEALEAAGVELTAAEAARWAGRGYLPEEAGPLILDGITAEQQGEMEDHAAEQVGGPEALAAMRVAELLGSGALLGPDDVVTVQDPMDPNREIIALRDDLER
jgi:hypothetical protein